MSNQSKYELKTDKMVSFVCLSFREGAKVFKIQYLNKN